MFTLPQEGGRIDRGNYIGPAHANRLPPLNVGDEYVLFIKLAPNGTLGIMGFEEGVFRIRNGRVQPLGGGAADAWRDPPSVRFFEELEKKFR